MTGASVLIAALSGRALAAAARRGGHIPLVADLFADDDTAGLAAGLRRVRGDLASGFDAAGLLQALADLASEARLPPAGMVYGAGFEDRPDLLRRIAARWPLLGNAPETVEAVKRPQTLAAALSSLAIPHPAVSLDRPGRLAGWLAKRAGGAGGCHIGGAGGERTYYQRKVRGRSVSALFLAHRGGADIIGFSEQWTSPSAAAPFRFGGAARPAALGAATEQALRDAARKAAIRFGLRGLNSADFILGEGEWWLIEINPRPGATLDLFDDAEGALFRAHLAAVKGEAREMLPSPINAAALEIVYAPRPIPSMPRLDWPDWIADRPPPGAAIPGDAPCWTVLASAKTAGQARRLCRSRALQSLAAIGSSQEARAS